MEQNLQRLQRIVTGMLGQDNQGFDVTTEVVYSDAIGIKYHYRIQFRSVTPMDDIEGDDESLHNMTVWVYNDGSRLSCWYDMDIQWNYVDVGPEAWFINEYAMAPWLVGVIEEYKIALNPQWGIENVK